MSIVGPRPLLASYLPYYTEQEKKRHIVRPGLTGLAQVRGRSFIPWEEIFKFDIYYVEELSLMLDVKIFIETIKKVLLCKDIADVSKAQKGENGNYYYIVNGEKIKLHKSLIEERKEKVVIK